MSDDNPNVRLEQSWVNYYRGLIALLLGIVVAMGGYYGKRTADTLDDLSLKMSRLEPTVEQLREGQMNTTERLNRQGDRIGVIDTRVTIVEQKLLNGRK